MINYQKPYLILFNIVTDTIHALEESNYGQAAQLLRQAQQQAEELFLDDEEPEP